MKTDPAWRRHCLLATLLVLGFLYIVLFVHFRHNSRNFIDAQLEQRAERHAVTQALTELPQHWQFLPERAESRLLGAGWWPPDKQGASLARAPGQLLLPLGRARRAVRLDFTIDLFAPFPGASVGLYQEGRELARWHLQEGTRLPQASVVLPPQPPGQGLARLELRPYGPSGPVTGARPAKTGEEIFLLLRELHLSQADAPPPKDGAATR